jgi:hypothetical protein
MKATDIEQLNQQVGGSCLYLRGETVKSFPNAPTETTDHQAFEDDQLYCFSEIGIWKVD